jgi:hypothetical protein
MIYTNISGVEVADNEQFIEEEYYSREGEKVYEYSYDNGAWTKQEDSYNFNSYYSSFLTEQITFLTNAYSESTYDAKQKAYVATCFDAVLDGSICHIKNLTVKFVNGKLIYLTFKYTEGTTITGEKSIFCYDYGTTTVTLPAEAQSASVSN